MIDLAPTEESASPWQWLLYVLEYSLGSRHVKHQSTTNDFTGPETRTEQQLEHVTSDLLPTVSVAVSIDRFNTIGLLPNSRFETSHVSVIFFLQVIVRP
jgi:hypothetical protein